MQTLLNKIKTTLTLTEHYKFWGFRCKYSQNRWWFCKIITFILTNTSSRTSHIFNTILVYILSSITAQIQCFCTACSRLVWDLFLPGPLNGWATQASALRVWRVPFLFWRCFNLEVLVGWGCCSNTKWPFFLFSPGVPASVFKILLLLVPSITFTCAGLQLREWPSMGLLSPTLHLPGWGDVLIY